MRKGLNATWSIYIKVTPNVLSQIESTQKFKRSNDFRWILMQDEKIFKNSEYREASCEKERQESHKKGTYRSIAKHSNQKSVLGGTKSNLIGDACAR